MTDLKGVRVDAYRRAQRAISELKASICAVLSEADQGLTNAQVGRVLGIYQGHVGHEGHISRTLLQMMKAEGVVEQDDQTKRWALRQHSDPEIGQD